MLSTQPRTPPRLPAPSSSQFRFMAAIPAPKDHDSRRKNNFVASTALRQVIGFNPCGKGFPTLDSVVSATFHGPGQRKVGPKSPRSALQDLLATAREAGPSNGTKPSFPEKPKEVTSESRPQAGCTAESNDLQSLGSDRIAQTQAATGLEQALAQSLDRTEAIGFAAVLVESGDNTQSFFRNLRISDSRDYRQQHASGPKGCRQKQYGRNSVFLRLATSPSTPDYSSVPAFSMDFLNSCYLCKRRLTQGRDVFMYNGDKAFCSEECRYQQIVMDERKEKGPPAVIRSGSVSGMAHHAGHHQARRCKNPTAAAA